MSLKSSCSCDLNEKHVTQSYCVEQDILVRKPHRSLIILIDGKNETGAFVFF